MGDAFLASPETIGGLLSSMRREIIVVPPFQRGYMWQQKHITQFWQDVIRFQTKRPLKGEQDQYFLGPIVTLARPKPEEIILLLDGQQRLATATILFSVLRDLAREGGTPDGKEFAHDIQVQLIERTDGSYSLKLGETDEVYFRETIQFDTPTSRKPTIRTHYNIKNARRILMEKLKAHIGQLDTPNALRDLKALRQTLVSDLVMTRIPVDTERDAFQIFETLNARGLKLQAPDLLLNFLMREAPPKDRKEIRDYWTEMIQRMERFDINIFLRHVWISKYGDLKETDLFTALKEQIETQNTKCKDFARTCADECESYVQLLKVEEKYISKDTLPFLKSLVRELGVQAAMPLLLSSYSLLKPKDFGDVVKWGGGFILISPLSSCH